MIGYGKETLRVRFPKSWRVEILAPAAGPSPLNDLEWINHALDHPVGAPPLEHSVREGEKVAVIVNDISRLWQKPDIMLGAVVERLHRTGVKDQDILVVIAAGMHRCSTRDEQEKILGPFFIDRFTVINHDCRDERNLVAVGKNSFGETIRLNRMVLEADRVITTGAIALHGLAGFAGGCKSLLPGVAALECIQRNHGRALDGDFNLRAHIKQGFSEGNPLHGEMVEAARLLGEIFMLNVVVGARGEYVHGVSGDIVRAHRAGSAWAKAYFEVPVKSKAPLVVAGAGGYPRDLDMYQSIKALGNAGSVTEDGGTVIFLSRCTAGLGSDEWLPFLSLGSRRQIGEHLARRFSFPGFVAMKALSLTARFRVILVSSLPPDLVVRLHMESASSLDEALIMAANGLPEAPRVYLMPWAGATVPVFSP